ncbi:DUF4197 domain-containing protein [Arcobacteraceae bacterium]|nr:DUF4197 domain-containing protein [Arcobacteraceae bacterium]
MKKKSILSSILLITTVSFSFDFGSLTKSVVDTVKESVNTDKTTQTETSSLSNDIISSGLKEALSTGVNFAVKELGTKDGYLNNASVKIPLPDNLAKIETVIRKAGGDKVVDDLVTSINNAATSAVPETTSILLNAVSNMNLEDAKKILAGNSTAATDFFQSNTTTDLKKLISPIIKKSMDENQVAKYYTSANSFYKSNLESYTKDSSISKYATQFGVDSYIPTSSDKDLDEFITEKAIRGLFKMIAQKESAIRKDPVEQTTSLLKKVFSK